MLAELAQAGLQSDARYVEAYVRSRRAKGFGPLRIVSELRSRGVPATAFDAVVDATSPAWEACAAAALRKRFGASAPADARERARQARFLEQRGYSTGQIRRALQGEVADPQGTEL